MRIKIGMAFLLCLLPVVCLAQDLQSFSARVSVSVSANEKIKGLIESYISSELRSLSGIVVTDVSPRWVLSIVALEPETKGGFKMGVTLSTVVLEPFDNRYVVSFNAKSKEGIIPHQKSYIGILIIGFMRVLRDTLKPCARQSSLISTATTSSLSRLPGKATLKPCNQE
jgi:hypothetical protein